MSDIFINFIQKIINYKNTDSFAMYKYKNKGTNVIIKYY